MIYYRRLIAMGLAAFFLALCGCSQGEDKFKPAEDAVIMSLGISESQMDFSCCYSFFIHEEDDGTVRFSAEYQPPEDVDRVSFDDIEVDKTDMDALRNISEENGIVEYMKAYKKVKTKVFALDAPSYSTSIQMSDGSSRTIDSLGENNGAVLRDFFTELAKKASDAGASKSTTYD